MIIIDTREQYKEEIKIQLEQVGITVHLLQLEHYADYLVSLGQQVMGVQRKTMGELLTQMGEIRARLPELSEAGYTPVLLVEEEGFKVSKDGKILLPRGNKLYETGTPITAYYNFLASVKKSGVDVVTVKDLNFSIWWLYSLHRYIQEEHYPHLPCKYTTQEQLVGALMGVPGVGEKKAKALIELVENPPTHEKKAEKSKCSSEAGTLPLPTTKDVNLDAVLKEVDELEKEWAKEQP